MNIWEWIRFSPKTLEEYSSKYNSSIKVVSRDNQISVLVDDLTQSGPVIERLWNQTLKIVNFKPKNLLVLGVGTGSIFKVAKSKWPDIEAVGVEIDPQMISIANKYFKENLSQVEIIIDDATKRVKCLLSKFDLVIIDLYKGKQFPHQANNLYFLKNLKQLLSPNGICIFNQLYIGRYKKDAINFNKKVTKVFTGTNSYKNAIIFPTNLLIYTKK